MPSSSRGIIDPMLQAAAEGMRPDHLRWLSYADAELARLRDAMNLPTPNGYSVGLPNYETGASERAQQMVRDVELRMAGRFSPSDRIAVAEVLDDILKEASNVAVH